MIMQPPRSFAFHASALHLACYLARSDGRRYRVWKGTSGRWLVTVVRP